MENINRPSIPEKVRYEEVPWQKIRQLCNDAIKKDKQERSKLPPIPSYNERVKHRHETKLSVEELKRIFPEVDPDKFRGGEKVLYEIEVADSEIYAPFETITRNILNNLLQELKRIPVWEYVFTTENSNGIHKDSIYLMSHEGTLRIKMANLRERGLAGSVEEPNEGTLQTPSEQIFFWPPKIPNTMEGNFDVITLVPKEVSLVPVIGYYVFETSSQAFVDFTAGKLSPSEYQKKRMRCVPDLDGIHIIWGSPRREDHSGHQVNAILSEIPLVFPSSILKEKPSADDSPKMGNSRRGENTEESSIREKVKLLEASGLSREVVDILKKHLKP